MKKLILPLSAILIGGAAGVALAFVDRGEDSDELPVVTNEAAAPCGEPTTASEEVHAQPIATEDPTEYAVIGKQFLVPIIDGERLAAMMLVSLSVEVPEGQTEAIYEKEPRIRDALLQDLFTHANIGGFTGNYTEGDKMLILRRDLLASVRDVVGEVALDVLVLDIVRQDI